MSFWPAENSRMAGKGDILRLFLVLALVCGCICEVVDIKKGRRRQNKAEKEHQREGRILSLFNVVRFQNTECTVVSDSSMMGICFTRSECEDKGGSADGNCAAGFGVCCMFSETDCGGDVAQNLTYLQNEGFPEGDNEEDETCEYNIERTEENICQIRLDFDTLTLLRDDQGRNCRRYLGGDCGADQGDGLTVSSPFSGSEFGFPPSICGTLTGQHLYFESGDSGDAGTVTILKGPALESRRWKIKVTYIECDNPLRSPMGCSQYYTGVSGNLQTLGFGESNKNQLYTQCVRQEEGFCSLQLMESTSDMPDPFEISGTGGTPGGSLTGETSDDCRTRNSVILPTLINDGNIGRSNAQCGKVLNYAEYNMTPGAVSISSPFMITYRTTDGDQLAVLTGYNLNYVQKPC